jgi:hypothetical protein
MAAPTATINKVRYRLVDLSATNPELATATTLQEAIDGALSRYSGDRPRTLVADVAGNGTEYYPLVGTGELLSFSVTAAAATALLILTDGSGGAELGRVSAVANTSAQRQFCGPTR